MDVLGKNGDLLLKLMSASAARHDAIASNLANQNVAGYKRQEVQFESLVLDALNTGGDPGQVEVQLEVDDLTPGRADGNNVVVEDEVALQRENLIRYQLWSTLIRSKSSLIESAIHGDR